MKTCSFVRKWLLKRFPPKQYSVAWKMPPCKSQPPGRISPQAPFKAWKIQRLLVVYSVGPKPVDILPDPRMSTPCRTRLLPGQTVPVSPHTRRLDAPLPGSLDAREHSPLNWSRYFLIIFWIKSFLLTPPAPPSFSVLPSPAFVGASRCWPQCWQSICIFRTNRNYFWPQSIRSIFDDLSSKYLGNSSLIKLIKTCE